MRALAWFAHFRILRRMRHCLWSTIIVVNWLLLYYKLHNSITINVTWLGSNLLRFLKWPYSYIALFWIGPIWTIVSVSHAYLAWIRCDCNATFSLNLIQLNLGKKNWHSSGCMNKFKLTKLTQFCNDLFRVTRCS